MGSIAGLRPALSSLNPDPSGIVGGWKNVKLKLSSFRLILHSSDGKQTLPHQVLQTGMERREYARLFLWLRDFSVLHAGV